MSIAVKQIDQYRYLVPRSSKPGMKVDGLIYADEQLIGQIERDLTLEQIANVATLPGLVGRSLAMPDAHQGYGFPIGGVAAADIEKGIVSAGGVGFDINCGVRLLATGYDAVSVEKHLDALLDRLFRTIPCGTGTTGVATVTKQELDSVIVDGASWAVARGYGLSEDLRRIEEGGVIAGADPACVSDRAKERGKNQLGTLGSGNHFLEIQRVDEVFDAEKAAAFGLHRGQIVVLIHTGSRGFGHQVCTDYLDIMQKGMRRHGITVVDRQLACVPVASDEGCRYLAAMAAAANFAFCNRQMITHWTREAFAGVLGPGPVVVVYDVAHNIAKREEYDVDGRRRRLLVHRKGATRAFPPGHPDVPAEYRGAGQPVLIPGSMGTASYVLAGTERAMRDTFGSTCHGAGRAKSRTAAKKEMTADQLIASLEAKGIRVRGASKSGLTEESPDAYKDVDEVVHVVHEAGISLKVARLVPVGVIKG